MTERKVSRVTIYRDNSTSQIVYEHVKHAFWTANNTTTKHISWFKKEPMEVK